MNEEKLKIAVFIDFDNIQIGVRSTLSRDFDLALVLEALKERGEVVTKIAYGNWKRAGELTRTLTQNAVLMVQRDLTPRGDKNGADINLALDALEMAINHPHINAFVVVGGDSDFIALVEKLKQYNKAVFVVGGRSFTSSVLQRNCREFLAYENLVEATAPPSRQRDENMRRREVYPLSRAVPLIYRGLKMLADREVQPQLGLLKSTLIQLDSTFNERDYGSSSFRAFVQKMADSQLLTVRQQGNSFLVEPLDREPVGSTDSASEPAMATAEGGESFVPRLESEGGSESAEAEQRPSPPVPYSAPPVVPTRPPEEALELLQRILVPLRGTNPRPLYLRNVKQLLRAEAPSFDEQQHGFASLVDLLRAGQSQTWLRLQRDRRGALRVFIPPAPGTAAAASEGAGPSVEPGNRAERSVPREIPEDDDRQPIFSDDGNSAAVAVGVAAAPVASGEPDPEDSQIAVLGYYRGIHGEDSGEAQLSIAEAIADGGGRKKRGPRKPKSDGGPPSRRRKPKH
ncbi:MAG TPA: NYN domain-containing protein [Terriglobales bacterium]|nr:NYN domain-containing protein [Terriglobales bacterium]